MQPRKARREVGEATIRLTLLERRDCHLCHEMEAVVRELAPRFGASVEVLDVDGDERLRRLYGEQVPVLLVNGRKAFKYGVTARELNRRLEGERRRGRGFWQRLVGPA